MTGQKRVTSRLEAVLSAFSLSYLKLLMLRGEDHFDVEDSISKWISDTELLILKQGAPPVEP